MKGMPAVKAPVTFNDFVSAVITGHMTIKGKSREDMGVLTGLGFSLFDNNMRGRGKAGWTAAQLTVIAGVLGTDPGQILQTALTEYGGVAKLIADMRQMSAARSKTRIPSTDTEVLGTLTQLGRRASEGVDQERSAALTGKKELDQ